MKDFIKARELVVGHTYLSRQNRNLVFLGKFDEYTHDWETYTASKKKRNNFTLLMSQSTPSMEIILLLHLT